MKSKISDEAAFQALDVKLDKVLQKVEDGDYAQLSKTEKMIYLVLSYESGTRNGGIGCFLANPSGRYAEDLLVFLREIKATAVAKDLEEVVQNIRGFCPNFLKGEDFTLMLKDLPTEAIDAYQAIDDEMSRRLFEYSPTLPQLLYEYLNQPGM